MPTGIARNKTGMMEKQVVSSSAYQRLKGLMDEAPSTTMSPAEKLRTAIRLSELGIAMKRQQIRNLNPDLSETRQTEMFTEWLLRRPASPVGDSAGRLRPKL